MKTLKQLAGDLTRGCGSTPTTRSTVAAASVDNTTSEPPSTSRALGAPPRLGEGGGHPRTGFWRSGKMAHPQAELRHLRSRWNLLEPYSIVNSDCDTFGIKIAEGCARRSRRFRGASRAGAARARLAVLPADAVRSSGEDGLTVHCKDFKSKLILGEGDSGRDLAYLPRAQHVRVSWVKGSQPSRAEPTSATPGASMQSPHSRAPPAISHSLLLHGGMVRECLHESLPPLMFAALCESPNAYTHTHMGRGGYARDMQSA